MTQTLKKTKMALKMLTCMFFLPVFVDNEQFLLPLEEDMLPRLCVCSADKTEGDIIETVHKRPVITAFASW